MITIQTKNQSDKNIYVKQILVNGKIVKNHTLQYQDIKNGGIILFEITDKHQVNRTDITHSTKIILFCVKC
ncbi:glycoside hydrolase domain-containing protein [Cloacibacterium sp.]|uniref:glycoside hydrolase domain-containing protein n=1 Tax=Cloacibacterium sp. TaxID=1913682 RepID=UPI0035B14B0F